MTDPSMTTRLFLSMSDLYEFTDQRWNEFLSFIRIVLTKEFATAQAVNSFSEASLKHVLEQSDLVLCSMISNVLSHRMVSQSMMDH